MKLLISMLMVALAALSPAFAGPTDGAVRVELRPGWREDGRHVAALHLHLAPGWKTYWRSPGEGGIPPQIQVNGHKVAIHWPVPRAYDQGGMQSIGYTGQVVFPLLIANPSAGAQAVQLQGTVGVCQDICVPVDISANLTLPAQGHFDPVIGRALKDRPMAASAANVQGAHCTITPIRDGMRVITTIQMPRLGADEVVVLEPAEPRIWVSPSVVSRQGDALTVQTDFVPPNGKPFGVARSGIRFTVLADGRATTWLGCTAS